MSVDFEMDAGETTEYGVTVTRTDPDTGVVSPVDIRGADLRFAMKPRSGAPVVTKTSDDALQITIASGSPGNIATIFFVTGDTEGISANTVFDYTLRLIEISGDVTDIARGKILVRPAIATGP